MVRGTDGRESAEEPLSGGNAADGVVRVGATVRKPWEPTTPAVQELMCRLAAAGVDVPTPGGPDEQGRQVLEFVPGELALHAPALTLAELARVGRLARAVHDVCEGFVPSAPAPWDPLLPAPEGTGTELVCDGDLTPWNLLLGERWVVIDWDGAGPSTRLWDLAYTAQAFTLNDPAEDPAVAAQRLAALVDGYDPSPALRARLPRTVADRAQAMHDLLEASHRSGREPWGSMYVSGHGEHWLAASRYAARHREHWERALER